MDSFSGLEFRPLGPQDVEAALALSAEAGWNQSAEDWRLLINGSLSLGVVTRDGRLVASALGYLHGNRVAWIAMVLVSARFQRRGLATEYERMFEESLA